MAKQNRHINSDSESRNDGIKPVEFLNPFERGVSYKAFLESIPKDVSLYDHCKGHLTNEQIEFLKSEIELIKK